MNRPQGECRIQILPKEDAKLQVIRPIMRSTNIFFGQKVFFGFNASTIGTYKTISQKETVARNGNNKNGTGRTGSNNGLFELALKLCQDRMKEIPIDVKYISMIDMLGLGKLRHLSSIQINQEKTSHKIG